MSVGDSKLGSTVSAVGLFGKLGWLVRSATLVPPMFSYTSRNTPVDCPCCKVWRQIVAANNATTPAVFSSIRVMTQNNLTHERPVCSPSCQVFHACKI